MVLLALPAVLFSIMAKAHWSTLAQPGLATVCATSMLCVHLPVMAWLLRRGASLTDASIDALGASYANTGFMGIALTMLTLGAVALPGVGLWDPRQCRGPAMIRSAAACFLQKRNRTPSEYTVSRYLIWRA